MSKVDLIAGDKFISFQERGEEIIRLYCPIIFNCKLTKCKNDATFTFCDDKNQIYFDYSKLGFFDGEPFDGSMQDAKSMIDELIRSCYDSTVDIADTVPQIETHGYTLICVKDADGNENYYLAYGVYDEVSETEVGMYKPIGSSPPLTDADLASAEICALVQPDFKQSIEPYRALVTATKSTFTPSNVLDSISVSIRDQDQCNTVRVTYMCPDGNLGCTILDNYEPIQNLNLGEQGEVVGMCFEIVQPDNNITNPCNWITVEPTGDVYVSVNGLNVF